MGAIVGVLIYLTVIGTLIYGWVINIIWILNQEPIVANGETIISILGIIMMPLGTLMGFLH